MLVKELIKELEKLEQDKTIECSSACYKCNEITFYGELQIFSRSEIKVHIEDCGFEICDKMVADYYI